MKYSIITAVFNRAIQMENGLKSILSQNLPLDGELIVLDDGSVDNTREVCANLAEIARAKKIGFKYIYLDHPEHRISCIPHNIGIKEAKGDVVIFTESECLHVGDTINQVLQRVTENNIPLATQIWSMGEKIWRAMDEADKHAGGKWFIYPSSIISHPYAMLVSGNMQNINAPDADFGITGSNNCYAGCLFAVNKKDLLAVGGFDESFQGFGWDDWDLLHRLELYGKSVEECNDIIVINQWHEKKYPYNIYEAGERNGKISEANIHKGIYKVNDGDNWGELPL